MAKKQILMMHLKTSLILFLFFIAFFPINFVYVEGKKIVNSELPKVQGALYLGLNFSTYFGGNDWDEGACIAVANDGSCYITGHTESSNFPIKNAYNSTYSGNEDVYVAKFSFTGSLLWSTYLGGNRRDYGKGIAVNDDGSCYVTGYTYSPNFPTKLAYLNTLKGDCDAFVAKFSSNGSLLWSTFLGGDSNDYAYDVVISKNGYCFIAGYTDSHNFPTKNGYDSIFNGGNSDAFIAIFNSGGFMFWSTYLGGSSGDYCMGIDVASDESFYVTGYTYSSNFPILNAYDITGCIFITKFSFTGSLLWSTYFGSDYSLDDSNSIAVANDGSCYIIGDTTDWAFPTLNAYDSKFNGICDVFVAKFSVDGLLLWSTYLGGRDWDFGYAIDVDSDGSCYVTGQTDSRNFPALNAFQNKKADQSDLYVVKFSTNGSLLWSTFLGGDRGEEGNGITIAGDGSCYVTGKTGSTNFPTLNAYNSTKSRDRDVFITKFNKTIATKQFSSSNIIIIFFVMPIIVFFIRKRKK